MDNNRPNSTGSKEEKPKVEKVVTGAVNVKQKKGVSKIAEAFFGNEEEISEIKNRVVYDTVIPTIKDIFLDTLATLLGVNRSRFSSGGRRITAERVSYGKYYEDSRSSRPPVRSVTAFNTDDVVFDQNGDAEYVLDRMFELLEKYGVVRVTDFYDLAGVSVDYTASKYGWTSLKNTRVIRTRDGYIVDLPRSMPID